MSMAVGHTHEVGLMVEQTLPTFTCGDCSKEVAIVNVVRGEEGATTMLWGNPDYPPICPHCGSKNTKR